MKNIAVKDIKLSKITEITLDSDAALIEADKYESKKTYKGFRGMQSLMGFIYETGGCIYEEFRNGNTSPSEGILKQLLKTHKYLNKRCVKIKNFRSDYAGYQSFVINYCESAGIDF